MTVNDRRSRRRFAPPVSGTAGGPLDHPRRRGDGRAGIAAAGSLDRPGRRDDGDRATDAAACGSFDRPQLGSTFKILDRVPVRRSFNEMLKPSFAPPESQPR